MSIVLVNKAFWLLANEAVKRNQHYKFQDTVSVSLIMISNIISSKENNCFLGQALWANKPHHAHDFSIFNLWLVKVTEIQNVFTQLDSKRKQCENCSQSIAWLAPPINKNKNEKNNVIFIFFCKKCGLPNKQQQQQCRQSKQCENCSSSKVLLSGVLLFGFGVGQHVTHTKGFVLASLSGAHCGYTLCFLLNVPYFSLVLQYMKIRYV